MSARIIYKTDDPVSVKKAFDTLIVKYAFNKAQVLTAMNNNAIATANADDWIEELSETVEVVQPWVVSESVKIGELRRYNNINYVVIQAHTTQSDWTPPVVPALFLSRQAPAPGETYPAWVQPTGGHDAYALGARVTYNGLNYESTINANVWSPTTFGWVQIT